MNVQESITVGDVTQTDIPLTDGLGNQVVRVGYSRAFVKAP